jgi:hypothetical protein
MLWVSKVNNLADYTLSLQTCTEEKLADVSA